MFDSIFFILNISMAPDWKKTQKLKTKDSYEPSPVSPYKKVFLREIKHVKLVTSRCFFFVWISKT